jgi:hypothetical protein
VQSCQYTDEIYYSIDNGEQLPWNEDSLFVGALDPGNHSINLVAGRCGIWDTTSLSFDIILNSISSMKDIELSAYPNPATNFLSVELPDEWNDATINVFDAQGGLKISTRSFGKSLVTLDCSKLTAGTYRIVLIEEQKKAVGSFLVLK